MPLGKIVTIPKNKVLILGVYLKTEAYPNVLYRLADLQRCKTIQISEINAPMWKQGMGNWRKTRSWRGVQRSIRAHLSVFRRYLMSDKNTVVYVPYPAVFILALISLLPKRLRPRKLVADAFISLYDTIVLDRKLIEPQKLSARFLKAVESRAYRRADELVVDTKENVEHLKHTFSFGDKSIRAVPLSTDEINFSFKPYYSDRKTCRVLFIGTFVPLHGVDVIVGAAEQLKTFDNIRFRLIGDGQTTAVLDRYISEKKLAVEWERQWQTSAQLAKEIEQADICLGIFGPEDKTQRVCPFKVYLYCAVGRAVITADTRWTRRVLQDIGYEPFVCVPAGDSTALAEAIIQLAENPDLREKASGNSRRFYESNLSNAFAMKRLLELLE